MTADRMVWVDIETTGLNPEVDAILELGIFITTASLERVASWSRAILTPGVAFAHLEPVVRDMHTKSGLLDECGGAGVAWSEREVVDDALGFLFAEIGSHEYGRCPMCGSSVHFDRAFLRARMPDVERFFHYRNVDVSSFKEAARLWGAPIEWPEDRKLHRAIPDCEDSIAVARAFRKALVG